MTTQLAFHDHKFSAVTHNNQIWLTATDIAAALEYADDKSVLRIYTRHTDEFTDGMASVVNLTIRGVQRENRIFSLRGAHLIAMFARTPVAKEFRRWVLDILDREVGEAITQPTVPAEEIYTMTVTRSELCSLCWGWSAGEYIRKGLEQVTPGLKELRSPLADSLETMAMHYQRMNEAVKIILERETRHIEPRAYAV